jgi:hypothetical protein
MQKILDFDRLHQNYLIRQSQMQNILHYTSGDAKSLGFKGGSGSCTTPHWTADLCQVGRDASFEVHRDGKVSFSFYLVYFIVVAPYVSFRCQPSLIF